MIHDGHEDIRSEEQHGPLEVRRGHAKDGDWILVETNNAAYHAAIILEMAVPVGVGENDVGRAVWAMLIGSMEEAAEVGVDTQYIEVVCAGFVFPHIGGIVAGVEPCLGDGPGSDIVEAVIALANIEIVGIGVSPNAATVLDDVEAVR